MPLFAIFFIIIILAVIILPVKYIIDRKKVMAVPASVNKISFFIAQQILLTAFLTWLAFAFVLVFIFNIEPGNTNIISLLYLILAVAIGSFLGSIYGAKSVAKRFQIDFQQIEKIAKTTIIWIISINIFLILLDFLTGKFTGIPIAWIIILFILLIILLVVLSFISFFSVHHFLIKLSKASPEIQYAEKTRPIKKTLIIVIIAILVFGGLGILALQYFGVSEETGENEEQTIGSGEETFQKFIVVDQPQPNSVVFNPVEIEGKASTFEGTVYIKIKDETGKELVSTFTTTQIENCDCENCDYARLFCPFSKTVSFSSPLSKKGTIEIFGDWPATHVSPPSPLIVPVIFQSNF
ncbi:MAG: Gmad2 immunoglobulin-like domain-containing protein [Candidatus Pacebacteria bacterium]|nr:Gmad2 immunoglobulin-like domain-containing protein [Candidatus Paceibacterota bacterium]